MKIFQNNHYIGYDERYSHNGLLAAFMVDNKLQFLVIGQYEDEIVMLDENHKKIKSFDQEGVLRLALTADGARMIATSQYDTTVSPIKDGSSLHCEGPEDSLWAMAYDAKNHKIYTGGDEGQVYVRDDDCKRLK